MNLFMIIPLFLVVTTGLWDQGMAQNTNTNGVLDTGSHHVIKRTIKRQAAEAPNTTCTSKKEGKIHSKTDGDIVWMCRSEEWTPHILISAVGTTSTLPGKSCKHIRSTLSNQTCTPQSGVYWVKVDDPCSEDVQTIQIYCDMTTDEGGWHLVWKHSYLQVSPLTTDMYYHSSFYKPCTDLSVGWCNVPNKMRLQPEEMMIAAYHNGILVYAYKGTFNRNIDHHWSGATLLMPVTRIVDRCTQGRAAPTPRQQNDLVGLIFEKDSTSGHSDTLQGTLANPSDDDRWQECRLPSSISTRVSDTQMTMVIYIR